MSLRFQSRNSKRVYENLLMFDAGVRAGQCEILSNVRGGECVVLGLCDHAVCVEASQNAV